MSATVWIYDTPALVGFAADTSERVAAGLRLIVDDPEFRLVVPAVCLIEAYAATPPSRHWRLDSLAINPGVTVVGLTAAAASRVGPMCGVTGRPGAAHAAYLAAGQPALVFTDATMPAEVCVQPA